MLLPPGRQVFSTVSTRRRLDSTVRPTTSQRGRELRLSADSEFSDEIRNAHATHHGADRGRVGDDTDQENENENP
jgi:hypothetical protein